MRLICFFAFSIIFVILSCTTDKYPLSDGSNQEDAEIIEQIVSANSITRTVNGQKCIVYFQEYNSKDKQILAPDSVIDKAYSNIVNKVGKEYADQYFVLHSVTRTIYPHRMEPCDSCYYFFYEYKVTIEDYTTILPVRLKTDLDGDLLNSVSLPDRLINPKLGMPITISDSIAVLLAQNDGLPGSMEPLEINFRITRNIKDEYTYAWRITSYYKGKDLGGMYITIDATNGDLIDIGGFIVATPLG